MKKAAGCMLLLLCAILLGSCNSGDNSGTDGVSNATMKRYQELEIREYEGVRLDPSVGPRDNSISGIQNVDISTYELAITGLVKESIALTYEEVLELPSYEKLITLHCVEGWDATVLWKGVLLSDLIEMAGADSAANTVIFHAVDGYTTALPLQDVIDKKIILAYSSNRIPLPPALGYPFIVVAEDKPGYKWARWVTKIELSDDPYYLGYWESRGFP
ncbi:molybdopterin-dependent oxidoreductase [Parasporobacterium paucivorans]|uniref:Oxidoreductase molybdopterin binding domain-containing protein n=1 Tax=Parasporobacterium paucivorans DSM 15970 TaxID=1122934 RepID=A0A1M6K7F0_9FIRM|nr:molybdopterin-dependent oxidoreductase [Parasporobacterium paucivorans]SHJ54928.1 Oxidoreductase molybdopterin binding domain-containing protein [Parasporobacterium paucivorans DSM 15970]